MGRLADFTTGTYTGISPANVNASGGYAETLAGALTSFAANTLRRTDKGLLVEPSATNVMPNSAAVGGTFSNSSGTITVTNNAAAAPDGATTADRVDINRSGNDAFAIFSQDVSPPAGTYVPSIWLKARTAGDVGKQVYAVLHAGSQKAVTVVTLTDAWVRYTFGSQASPTQAFVGYAESGWTGSNATGPVSFLAWGLQATLNTLSSDIMTTGSASTRSADAVSFTVPAGNTLLTFTFDDDTTQDVSVTPGATYTVPTNLNRRYIKYIDGNGAASIAGTASTTLGAIGTAGSSTLAIKGNATATLGAIVSSGAAGALSRGQASVALGEIGAAGSASLKLAGTSAQQIGDVQVAAAGSVKIAATAAVTLGPVTTESAARADIAGSATIDIGEIGVTATGTGQSVNAGTATSTLGEIAVSSASRLAVIATVAQQIGPIAVSSGASAPVAASATIQIGAIATGSTASIRLQGQTLLSMGPIGVVSAARMTMSDFIVPSPFRTAHAPARRRVAVAPARARIIFAKEPRAC